MPSCFSISKDRTRDEVLIEGSTVHISAKAQEGGIAFPSLVFQRRDMIDGQHGNAAPAIRMADAWCPFILLFWLRLDRTSILLGGLRLLPPRIRAR